MERGLADESPRRGFNSDDDGDDDDASGYSSCDGSEFDRYCSANSAFGSASQCSSVGRYSDFFDSVKIQAERNGHAAVIDGIGTGSRLFQGEDPAESASAREEETLRAHLADNLGSCSEYGMMLEGDAGGLSDCDRSDEGDDDDDSMLGYGSGDAGRICSYGKNSVKVEHENPLLMNSSVAFGSGDWEEFEQESKGNGFDTLSLYRDGDLSLPIEDHVDGPVLDGTMMLGAQVGILQAVSSQEEGNPNIVNPLRDQQVIITQKPDGYSRSDGDSTTGSRSLYEDGVSQKPVIGEPKFAQTTTSDTVSVQLKSNLSVASHDREVAIQEIHKAVSSLPIKNSSHHSSVQRVTDGNSISPGVFEEKLVSNEVKKMDTHDAYDEMVLEMEEILLDSSKSHGARSAQVNQGKINQQSHHFRDGSSTASTSGTDDVYPLVHHPAKIDRVDVVGARQKKGDVSFGERLVGVKEFTVYKIRVWSGSDQWEVERRYRDFDALYRQLKTLFADHGLTLPSPWSNIEQESRKIFGNASPAVISERSNLIQQSLRSILNSRYPFGTPYSFLCFLAPNSAMDNSGMSRFMVPRSPQKVGEDEKLKSSSFLETTPKDISMFGKTISLVVEMKPQKSVRQLLEEQQYTCAGCHKHLDPGKTLLQEIVQTLGWNKARLCEYTGQLFCASCHTNDTAVLPARVLHLWDFSLYPVSQLAKAYLESIYNQPMLCVSAVNPFLFSKVPALLHVVSIRKKVGAMLPCIRCPFRKSIQRGLGFRRHLIESNDFFALRDLVDLSKGAFAALPVMLETISTRIFEHITQQCLECYDAGAPCAARRDCVDNSQLIFPFQEAEAARCSSCGSIFHKHCFESLMGCSCSKPAREATENVSHGASAGLSRVSGKSIQSQESSSTLGLFSDFLSKARTDKIWKPRNKSNVILMGSLPSTSL